MVRPTIVLLALLTPSIASADEAQPAPAQPATHLHRIGYFASAGANTPITLEVVVRPHPMIELSAAYATGNVYCHCSGEFLGPGRWDRYTVVRYEGVARVIQRVDSASRTHVALHAGVGLGVEDGEKAIGTTSGLFGDPAGDTDMVTTVDGVYGRVDAGITVERSIFAARVMVGLSGRDSLPFASLGLGLGF